MPDNFQITEGSGKTIGARDNASVLYQRIQPVLSDNNDVGPSHPMPAKIGDGTNNLSLTSLGSLIAAAIYLVDASGVQITAFDESAVSSATLTNVASSASSVQLLAANAARKGMLIFNESTAVLYLKLGTTASVTSYSVQIAAGGYWEMPKPRYTGRIDGIWAAANGNARITEL